jgi:hypothetical protein
MKEKLLKEIETLRKSLSNPMLAQNPQFKTKIEEQLAVKEKQLAEMEKEAPAPKPKPEPKETPAPKPKPEKRETPAAKKPLPSARKAEPKARPAAKKAAPKAKAEPKAKPAEKKATKSTNQVVIGGKTYSLEDCEDAFKAWNAKKKQNVQASEKSENKQITTKVSDKVETLTKQVFADASVKKKMEKDPAQAKRDIRSFVKALEALFGAIEKLTGKKISKTNRDKIISLIDDNQ